MGAVCRASVLHVPHHAGPAALVQAAAALGRALPVADHDFGGPRGIESSGPAGDDRGGDAAFARFPPGGHGGEQGRAEWAEFRLCGARAALASGRAGLAHPALSGGAAGRELAGTDGPKTLLRPARGMSVLACGLEVAALGGLWRRT